MTQTEADKRVRPDAMDDATVEAVGAVSEALECVERHGVSCTRFIN
jgi:hypothetical protein